LKALTTPPNGTSALSDATNATGYVTFANLTAGNNSFSIFKDGYEELNQTVNLHAAPVKMTLALTTNGSGQTSSDGGGSMILTVVVLVIVVVLVVVVVVILKRRRRSELRLPPLP
jgi:hypothetical protein